MTNEHLREVAKEIINIAFDKGIQVDFRHNTNTLFIYSHGIPGMEEIGLFTTEINGDQYWNEYNVNSAKIILEYVRNF